MKKSAKTMEASKSPGLCNDNFNFRCKWLFKILLVIFMLPGFSRYMDVRAQNKSGHEYSDTDSSLVQIVTNDGIKLIGQLIDENPQELTIRTQGIGIITLLQTNIKFIHTIDPVDIKKGIYWFENPNATRYLFSPTAIPLRKGEGYYQNTYLIINMFNGGLSDHFSLGGGFELISTFTGNPTIFITPKFSGKIFEKVYLGAGLIAGYSKAFASSEGGSSGTTFGIGYGVFTFGNRDNNITTGLGFGFANGHYQPNPYITISGMARISRKTGFVSENWIIPYGSSYQYVLSYGLRFMSENITVDFALLNNGDISQSILIGMPYVDFVVKLGK